MSDWWESALCAQSDPELFFVPRGVVPHHAKQICGRCPVIAECLADALVAEDNFGVRGGLTPRQRARLATGAHPGRSIASVALEQRLIALEAAGLSDREIARETGVSYQVVQTRRRRRKKAVA